MLEESDEPNKLAFTPILESHNATDIDVTIEFDNPSQLSIGGSAQMCMEVKETSIFKSAKNIKSMSKDSFEGGKPELGGALPP